MPLPPVANPRIPYHELYQDAWFVALDKPAGVVTQPGAGHKADSLLNGLFARDGATHERLGADRDWGLLHRLDKDTSGVVLVARMKEAYDAIRAQFEERSLGKTYLAVCRGRLPSMRGTCRQALSEVRRGEMKVSVPAQRGEACVTHWRTLASTRNHLVVACAIETGKLHQIRAHLAFLGAPIEGDSVYRSLLPPNTTPPKSRSGIPALRLHAFRVTLTHPGTKKRMSIEAPIPQVMIASMREACGGKSANDALPRTLLDALDQVRKPEWWLQQKQ